MSLFVELLQREGEFVPLIENQTLTVTKHLRAFMMSPELHAQEKFPHTRRIYSSQDVHMQMRGGGGRWALRLNV